MQEIRDALEAREFGSSARVATVVFEGRSKQSLAASAEHLPLHLICSAFLGRFTANLSD
jgi:hypothetical protein